VATQDETLLGMESEWFRENVGIASVIENTGVSFSMVCVCHGWRIVRSLEVEEDLEKT